jgi:hypothetical protein
MDHGIFYKHLAGPISIPFVSSQISTLSNIQSNTSEEGSASARVQAPETRVEQRCIKSCLHGPEVIRTYINELVIATSELEARASLIYTLSLLRCNEQEETVALARAQAPVEMFSQSFTTRCIGAARRSNAECKFRPSAICQRGRAQAPPPVSDYDFTYLGQLENQLGRRMHTMVMTSLCRHTNSRRFRAILTSIKATFPTLNKSVSSFVTKQVMWTLSGAPESSYRKPNPLRYKDPKVRIVGIPLLEALARAQAHPTILDLVNVHSGRFDHHALKIDPDEGYFSPPRLIWKYETRPIP